jgi:putative transposase
MWQALHDALRTQLRVANGRHAQPSAGILDSQSVKMLEQRGIRGYDAGKKIKGRKRHILVDTMGLLLVIVVHAASIQGRDGAKVVLEKALPSIPGLKRIWADGGYAGKLMQWVKHTYDCVLEIVKRFTVSKGFKYCSCAGLRNERWAGWDAIVGYLKTMNVCLPVARQWFTSQ